MSHKFLLTGGAGCLGSALVRHILDGAVPNASVVVFDPEKDHSRLRRVVGDDYGSRVQLVTGDVTKLPEVTAAVDQFGITEIIHLAALQVPLVKNDPLNGCLVNCLGTNVVYEVARARRDQIHRVVAMSSAAVYGPAALYPDGGIDEDDLLAPATLYGVHKQANEGTARIYYADYGVPSVLFRPWTVFGVGRDKGMTSTVTRAMANAVMGRDYQLAHGGAEDLNYLADLVAAIAIAAVEPFPQGFGIFNVPGHTANAQEVCALIAQATSFLDLPACSITPGTAHYTIASGLKFERIRKVFPTVPLTPLRDAFVATMRQFMAIKERGLLTDDQL